MRAPKRREQAAADDDVVGARAERDLDGDRLGSSPAQRRGHGVRLRARRRRAAFAQRGDDLVDDGLVRLVARLHR